MIRRAFLMLLLGPVAAGTVPEWSKAVPSYRIAGPVYFVGTADLGCYLIKGTEGDILLNTGLADSPALIVASIRSLGFDPKDIRILLTNQAHFDHMGGFAALQKLTFAQVFATAADAPLIEDGGASDPAGVTACFRQLRRSGGLCRGRRRRRSSF
jgi:metallo-beta-lactamase class B